MTDITELAELIVDFNALVSAREDEKQAWLTGTATGGFNSTGTATGGGYYPFTRPDGTIYDPTKDQFPSAGLGTYTEFDKVRKFTDEFDNLFLIGRNGQHRYNNQDHSMLTAIEAVKNIKTGKKDKTNIWNVNVEKEYHETK